MVGRLDFEKDGQEKTIIQGYMNPQSLGFTE